MTATTARRYTVVASDSSTVVDGAQSRTEALRIADAMTHRTRVVHTVTPVR